MAARDIRGGRKPRKLNSSARSWGTPAAASKPERPNGPSKREEAASRALASVLALFESEELPERIAETVIARQQCASPLVHWSLGNQLVALLNGTTDARGYRQWQEVGRHVVKGSRAFYILAPRTRKITETDAATGAESDRTIVTGFLGIPVFRYEDTDGDALDVPDYAPASFPPLYGVAERLSVSVAYAPFLRDYMGYYSPGQDRIVLCSHDVRTFFHELGHAAHARILRNRGDKLRGGQDAGQEIVAELTAAVLCRLYGFDGYLAASSDYIRAYGKDNPGRAALRALADVQAVLADILETAAEEELPAALEPELVAA